MSKEDDARLQSRMILEGAVDDYFQKCKEDDYEFAGDVVDVIFDATGGQVKLVEE